MREDKLWAPLCRAMGLEALIDDPRFAELLSLATERPVVDDLAPRLKNTVFLAVYAALIAIPLAIGLGLAAPTTTLSEGMVVRTMLSM